VSAPGKLAKRVGHWAGLAPRWVRSAWSARGRDFGSVETFCLFVGYPRSGHSLVGALLDAHPEAMIAHELHVLRYVKYGFSRRQIFSMLVEASRRDAERGRSATGYSYRVPRQWQGRARTLRVVGDKRGGTTIRKLRARPWLLPWIERRIGLPIRWIHVARNPFDNVATIHRRGGRGLEDAARHYFGMVDGVQWLRTQVPEGAILDVHHEAVLADPETELARLCRFLGLEPEPGYLADCASVVWRDAHRTRHDVDWAPALRESVAKRSADVPFLAGYRFDEG
jgi:hypothetical protein